MRRLGRGSARETGSLEDDGKEVIPMKKSFGRTMVLRARRAEAKFGSLLRSAKATKPTDADGEPDSQLKHPRRLPDLSNIRTGGSDGFGLEL